MRIDGRAIAESIYREIEPKFASFITPPSLGVYVVEADAVIESFVRIKMKIANRLGVRIIREDSRNVDTADAVRLVERLSAKTDAVIVQLPLPSRINTESVLSAVPTEKDVDAINPLIPENKRRVVAPVAGALQKILDVAGVDPKGKRAVVIGEGRLVGLPVAALLRAHGADVSVITLEQGSLQAIKDADILVSGAGSPGLVTPDLVKPGAVLIDAGTSEQSGKVVGDIDPACAEKSSVFTPVPGGVGPIAVAMIFKNLLEMVGKRP